ncbi:MAG: di-heme oxidoredictase family protein [Sulfurovum sp.]|nr:di-heme oxidoredictase family protein [Sulfurovum sp.]
MPKRHSYSIVIWGLLLASSALAQPMDSIYTTGINTNKVLMQEVEGLNDEAQDKAMLGFSFYHIPWVASPASTTARDGLGPLYNANTCIACHPNNGVGSVYEDRGNISPAYILKLSIESNGSMAHESELKYNGFIAPSAYGGQISTQGISAVLYEAKPRLVYVDKEIAYPDGTKVQLSQPRTETERMIGDLQYGALSEGTIISPRLAPALIGLGLLELLSDAQILANEDRDDSNGDGISGKANRVYSPSYDDFRVGRYTSKASVASVLDQTAMAGHEDMGLTREDLPQHRLEAIAFYLQNLKVPKSIIRQKEGEKLFTSLSCIHCHRPAFTLDNGYVIRPFSDMLLHDMGEGLSDGRSEFDASQREWRTAPLWGIGKSSLTLGKRQIIYMMGEPKA